MWLFDSASSVVQVCPRGGTYCRSSSQMTHCAGSLALSGYCVPQAVQMKRGMSFSRDVAVTHCPGLTAVCKAARRVARLETLELHGYQRRFLEPAR